MSLNMISAETNKPPAPEIIEIDPPGYYFANETNITVYYSVERFKGVNGILLVGEGSNLTINLNHALQLNFSHSLRDRSYYNGTFTLTSNTKFKAYSWSQEITNGTYEDLDPFNHQDGWHYLYARTDRFTPQLYFINATETQAGSGIYYAKENATINVKYVVNNGNTTNPESVTLAYSVHRDKIKNGSLVNIDDDTGINFIEMEFEELEEGTDYPIYQTTFNFTWRTIYFCANNSEGWDLHPQTGELNIYEINNGFSFSSKPAISELYTDIDDVTISIVVKNATEEDSFGIGYSVEQSKDNDTVIKEWEEIMVSSYTEANQTSEEGYNTTVRTYTANLGKYDLDNLIYYKAFNIYHGEIYNETQSHTIIVYDSKPSLSLKPTDGRYLNNATVNFRFEIEMIKGNVSEILFNFGDGNMANIQDLESNSTIHYYDANVSRDYNVTLSVIGTINTTTDGIVNTTRNVTHTIYLDFITPTCEITWATNDSVSTDGYISMNFTYGDAYGKIKRVWIYWGDGVVENITSANSRTHRYLEDGEYEVIIQVVDYAGNEFNVSIVFEVEYEIETPQETSFGAIVPILSFMTLGLIPTFMKKKKER